MQVLTAFVESTEVVNNAMCVSLNVPSFSISLNSQYNSYNLLICLHSPYICHMELELVQSQNQKKRDRMLESFVLEY